jgi:hypothetical protein
LEANRQARSKAVDQGERRHRAGEEDENIDWRGFSGKGELDERTIDGRSLVKRRG